jgi:putative two-component system response regulator
MVSARTEVDDRLRGYHAGADDYVTRPFEELELRAKVAANIRVKSIYGEIETKMNALCGATGEVLEHISHLRDTETGEHLDRIRIYSHLLAGELRQGPFGDHIDDAFLDNLYRASPLHDIGKVAMPDALLRKPGAFTQGEREQMKQHTLIGEQILNRLAQQHSDASFFSMAAQIARWHHESFDGTGYPDGLSGAAIPLAARIVKVADVFDALTSARVYKAPSEPAAARKYISETESAAFDPNIVDAMLRVFDEFTEVCNAAVVGEVSQPHHKIPYTN